MIVGLFSCIKSHRMRQNGLKLPPVMLRLDLRKKVLTERVVRLWNMLPKEVVESPCLEVFKRCVELVLGDML